ncbi:MAG: abortive phage infection protein [Lachnospiraceae bacterium]
MTKSDILEQLIEEDNGYLLTSKAVDAGVSKPSVSKYIKEHEMERVAQGIYILNDVWPDELFVLQKRNKNIIYSGETALYLHGLIDREYSHICFTVPIGYNATHIKNKNREVRYVNTDILEMGSCEMPSSSGNLVRLYNRERCICDLIKDRKRYEVQLYQTAIKEYMSSKDKNLSLLVEYAVKLGVRDEVMMYVEVMV